ncbi:MAG: FecR family protein [Bacteroidales bacterium]
MKLDENVSKIIANDVIGSITKPEREILNYWLADPYCKLIYDKITREDVLAKEVLAYENVDSRVAFKKFKREVINKPKKHLWMKYAAIIFLPILIGGVLFQMLESSFHVKKKVLIPDFDKSKLAIVSDQGDLHYLTGKDTCFAVGVSTLVLKSNQIECDNRNEVLSSDLIYNTINVPRGKTLKMLLADSSVVHLNSQSVFKYPLKFTGQVRQVELLSGEAYFEIFKDQSRPFTVNFGGSQVKVLGTKFNIRHYQYEPKKVTLASGSLEINSMGNKFLIKPNEQAIISRDSYTIKSIDARVFTDWTDYVFRYKREAFGVIMEDLARHYGLKVFYLNPSCKQMKYSLRISKKKNIEEVLQLIEDAEGVEFQINQNNIIVSKKM